MGSLALCTPGPGSLPKRTPAQDGARSWMFTEMPLWGRGRDRASGHPGPAVPQMPEGSRGGSRGRGSPVVEGLEADGGRGEEQGLTKAGGVAQAQGEDAGQAEAHHLPGRRWRQARAVPALRSSPPCPPPAGVCLGAQGQQERPAPPVGPTDPVGRERAQEWARGSEGHREPPDCPPSGSGDAGTRPSGPRSTRDAPTAPPRPPTCMNFLTAMVR